ncbi:protein MON2 homolog [Lingula anatina]|uniref:Protein MON2 homolog n=1 Tax=Lingula anatina TaxID=7574 RepID=A0A1S3HQI7_LINAN|nr:protein MON2 homolog [Lingula anatina]|eukprot:XP_013388300.1 protein MON2 homolog [Lingula anatina]
MRYHPGWTGTPKAEKAKKNAKDRRDKENDGLEKLKKVLPLSSNVISTLDKLSTMRLSVAYLWLKKKLEEEKESACLDANGNTCSTAVQSNDLASRMLQGHELLKCFDSFLIYVHKNGQIAYVSEQVEDYLGFKQTAMIGKHIFEFVLEQDHRELRKQFIVKPYKKTESNGTTITTYCQNREFCVHMNCQIIDKEKNSKSRGQLMVQWTGRLKIKNSLKPAGLICMCRPIYGDPMMEIRTQGNAFSSHHSLDLKYVDVDPRVTQLLGYEREDLIGKPVYLFHFPLDAKTISECHQTSCYIPGLATVRTLRVPLSAKYGCPSPTTWVLAINSLISVLIVGLPVARKHDVAYEGVWSELAHTLEEFLFSKHPTPSTASVEDYQRDEAIDCRVVQVIRDEILPYGAGMPKEFVIKIMHILNQGSIHAATTDAFIDTDSSRKLREEFAKACFETLLQFSFITNAYSTGEGTITDLAVSSMLQRCQGVIKKFVEDERLSGKCPLPRPRMAEMCSVLKAVATLLSSLKKAPQANIDPSIWSQVIQLYPHLVDCTTSGSPHVSKALKESLHEFKELLAPPSGVQNGL